MILTFSRVYKNQKKQYQNYGGNAPLAPPPPPPPSGDGRETCSRNLANRKNDLILIMTPEKQDKTLQLRKHWSVDSTQARNEVIMKRKYPVKLVKYDKICSNY